MTERDVTIGRQRAIVLCLLVIFGAISYCVFPTSGPLLLTIGVVILLLAWLGISKRN